MVNKALTKAREYIETEEEAAVRILSGFSYDDFKDCDIMTNRVVMAIYSEPEKTKGGIIVPKERREEAEYQGKCGLIIAMGPLAYNDDGQIFRGKVPKVGDWVVIHANDGRRIDIHGVQCRMFADTLTWMIVPHPEAIW